MAFESGKRTTVSKPISPADTTIYLASVPTVTSGRLYLKNDAQEERISYSGISWSTVTGCNRNLSKVNDPVTSGVWLTWVAWTVVKLVLMHDQIVDKAWANTRVGNQSITGDLDVSGYLEADRIKAIKWSYATTYATTADRDTALGGDGVCLYPYTWIQANGVFYNYNTSTTQRESIDTGTVTPNMSTSVTGKWRLADQTQVDDGTATEWWDPLVVWPAELKVVTDAILNPIYFWDGADGDVTINSWTTTLTRDMYYNNLTITSPWVLNPAGYRVFVKWTIAGTGTINRNGNNGWNWSNWVAWTAATMLWQWSLNAEIASVAWRAGNNSSWQNWIAWTAATNSLSNISSVAWWAWWAWWAGNLNPWWSAWASAASTRSNTYNKVFPLQLVHPATAWALTQATGISSSWWWASWSWDNGGYHNWWSWGWSWGNWGLVWIFANTWNFTWTCTATWWTGGNWSNAYIVVWWWSNAGWWGWGWWGNGGILLRCYKTLTADCTKTLTWWTWWTAWTGISWWASWTAGQNGNAWETITITV